MVRKERQQMTITDSDRVRPYSPFIIVLEGKEYEQLLSLVPDRSVMAMHCQSTTV